MKLEDMKGMELEYQGGLRIVKMLRLMPKDMARRVIQAVERELFQVPQAPTQQSTED